MNVSKILGLLAPVLLVGCSQLPTQEQPKQTNKQQQSVTVMEQASEGINAPEAVLNLIARSQQQIKDTNLTGAKTTLERALRITPRYPDSYYYLAKIHYLQGQYMQAHALCKKSLSLGAQGQLLENILRLVNDIDDAKKQLLIKR